MAEHLKPPPLPLPSFATAPHRPAAYYLDLINDFEAKIEECNDQIYQIKDHIKEKLEVKQGNYEADLNNTLNALLDPTWPNNATFLATRYLDWTPAEILGYLKHAQSVSNTTRTETIPYLEGNIRWLENLMEEITGERDMAWKEYHDAVERERMDKEQGDLPVARQSLLRYWSKASTSSRAVL